ncbi:unnamed protein product [Mytilus coruscus]|uniref:Apple domain-containing protein n=1 Tax=Mytilus coruscus TaxID=42192 RepID=A0A6J8DXT1_MYTCO|nr:unnamed protein product [Mytilus coruscus]
MFMTRKACLVLFVYTVASTAVNTTNFDLKSSKRIISSELIKRDVIVPSLIDCAFQCSSYDFCETASFDNETKLCNLSTSCNPDTLVSQTATSIRKRSTREFEPIFVACSGNEQSVLDTWRTPSMGGGIVNINDPCTVGHLRSSIIDNWNGSIIDQVH